LVRVGTTLFNAKRFKLGLHDWEKMREGEVSLMRHSRGPALEDLWYVCMRFEKPAPHGYPAPVRCSLAVQVFPLFQGVLLAALVRRIQRLARRYNASVKSERKLAVMMGLHTRLAPASLIHILQGDPVRLILSLL
jgi:hypothetical protein